MNEPTDSISIDSETLIFELDAEVKVRTCTLDENVDANLKKKVLFLFIRVLFWCSV